MLLSPPHGVKQTEVRGTQVLPVCTLGLCWRYAVAAARHVRSPNGLAYDCGLLQHPMDQVLHARSVRHARLHDRVWQST